MYDMSRGELRYTPEKGYYYENEIDEISYIKVTIAISIFILIGLGIYKYDYIKDMFYKEFIVESKKNITKEKVVQKQEPIKKEELVIKEKIIVKVEPTKEIVKKTIENNITVEAELDDEEDVFFFTSMGKTVNNSKIQDIYQEPKKDKNSTSIE